MSDVINHLWQSTLFGGLVAAAAAALRSNHAKHRYWLWLAASMKFLVPFSLLVSLGSQVPLPPRATVMPAAAVERIGVSFAPALSMPLPAAQSDSFSWVLAIWLAGSAGLALRWFRRWYGIHRALKTAHVLAGPVPVFELPGSMEPGVFGVFRPVLLLPEGITARLSAEELDSIYAHELAHVRRHDNLTAAMHMAVETLFWFHPLVWWIGAKLVEERERACDEEVLGSGKRRRVYAQGILNVCRYYQESPLACASGVTGADLKQRIREIMTHRVSLELTRSRKAMLGGLAVAVLATPLLIGVLRAQTPLTFELASIRPSDPNRQGLSMRDSPDGGLQGSGLTLKFLIQAAYDVQDFQITGGPAWVRTDRYDITAKTEKADPVGSDQTKADRWRERTRALLADRFKLIVRRESAERPIFALIEAKGGHKLTPATEGHGIGRNRGIITGDGVPVAMLVKALPWVLARPVLDRTGLTGKYSFKLQWAEESTGKDGTTEAADGSSIFAAIQDQLGLKLESTRGPVETLFIERAERPSEN